MEKGFGSKVTVAEEKITISEPTMMERYVIGTAMSLGRAKITPQINADMYGLTWLKDLVLTKETVYALCGGLDDYMCDLGGICGSIEENSELEEGDIDPDYEPKLDEYEVRTLASIAHYIFDVLNKID